MKVRLSTFHRKTLRWPLQWHLAMLQRNFKNRKAKAMPKVLSHNLRLTQLDNQFSLSLGVDRKSKTNWFHPNRCTTWTTWTTCTRLLATREIWALQKQTRGEPNNWLRCHRMTRRTTTWWWTNWTRSLTWTTGPIVYRRGTLLIRGACCSKTTTTCLWTSSKCSTTGLIRATSGAITPMEGGTTLPASSLRETPRSFKWLNSNSRSWIPGRKLARGARKSPKMGVQGLFTLMVEEEVVKEPRMWLWSRVSNFCTLLRIQEEVRVCHQKLIIIR